MDRHYKNFEAAIYFDDQDIDRICDEEYMEKSFDLISRYIKFDKVYIETLRGGRRVEWEKIDKAKAFFASKGIGKIHGGYMPYIATEDGHFGSYCFTDKKVRAEFLEILAESVARFDEFISDDLFIFNCTCPLCREAKGELSWSAYHLRVMNDFYAEMKDVIHSANPNCRFILKLPNWYEQYHFAGYNLPAGAAIFDEIHAGNETRDTYHTDQFLQTYQSYLKLRYFENVAPGRLHGGWVDPGRPGSWNRYAQQLHLTLFGKAKECTLWTYRLLVEAFTVNGTELLFGLPAAVTGDSFEKVDAFYGELGNPMGIMSYHPFNANGESYVHNYLGMAGFPMELTPVYPEGAKCVFLTEQCKHDPQIVAKMKETLYAGGDVVITSKLYSALVGKGIEDIVEICCPGNIINASRFYYVRGGKGHLALEEEAHASIGFSAIESGISNSDAIIQAVTGARRFPVMLATRTYEGQFFVLNLPENHDDIYHLPTKILDTMRQILGIGMPARLIGPAQISLFLYDNDTLILQHYEAFTQLCSLVVDGKASLLEDVCTGKAYQISHVSETETYFDLVMAPTAYKVLRIIR